MKVTVLTPQAASAKGYISEKVPNAYAVAAPDGLFYFNLFASAKAFAFSYVKAGIVSSVSFL